MSERDPFEFFENAADSVESAYLKNKQALQDLEDTGVDVSGVIFGNVHPVKSSDETVFSADDISAYSADEIEGHSSSTYWNTGNLNYYQPSAVYIERNKAMSQVDVMLLSLPDAHQMIDKISVLTSSMDVVINKLSRYGEGKQQQLISTCKEIKNNLQDRSKLIGHIGKSTKDASTEKIKWLGQLNVLSTLFYHLLKGQDGGNPYIEASVEVVKRMIANNFIDKEGHEISMETLKTYFTLSKIEKRAKEGDRIELPNKKTKK